MRVALIAVVIGLVLAGCAGDNEFLALETDLQDYSTEAVTLREQLQLDRTQVMVTVNAASTQITQHNNYNRIIQPTANAIVPATVAPIVNIDTMMQNASGPMPIEMFDLSDGQTRFVQVGVAGEITTSDRCFVAHQSFFTTNTNVIYLVALGLNIRVGTSVRAEWRYGGELVHQNTWSAIQSVDGQCIALEMRPANASFLPGNWTATLYVNGEPVDPAPFTIVEG